MTEDEIFGWHLRECGSMDMNLSKLWEIMEDESGVQQFVPVCSVVFDRQVTLSKGFSRQEYWSGLPFLSLGDIPNPGIEPVSPALAGRFFANCATWPSHVLQSLGLHRVRHDLRN